MREPLKASCKAALVVALAVGIGGCAVIDWLVERRVPPLTIVEQQYRSVERNLAQASGFEPHIGAFIRADLLQEVLDGELARALSNASVEGVTMKRVVAVTDLVNQGIGLRAEYDLEFPQQNVRAKGKLEGLVGIATSGDELQLRGAFSSIDIEKLSRIEGGSAVDAAVSSVARSLVSEYVESINRLLADEPTLVDLSWETRTTVDIASLVRAPGATVAAEMREVRRRFAESLVRIDGKGLAVLVALDEGDDASRMETELDATTAAEGGISAADLRRLFAEYSGTFDAIWASHLDPVDEDADAQVVIARSEIARLLNAVTEQPIAIAYEFDLPSTSFKAKVEVDHSSIDCGDVREPFKRGRYKRRGCDWGCLKCITLFGEKMCTDEPGCKASRALCNTKEEAKVAADNIAWNAEKARHDVEQEAKVAACNVWRESASLLALTRVDGDAGASGTATADFAGIRFSDDLSWIELADFSASMGGRGRADVKFTPLDLGHLFFCPAPYRFEWNAALEADIPRGNLAIDVETVRDGDDLVLTARFPDVPFSASATPGPLLALMNDTGFATRCPIGYGLVTVGTMTVVASRLGLIEGSPAMEQMMGRYSAVQKIPPVKQRFSPMVIRLGSGPELTAKATAGEKAIGFLAYR